MLCVGELVVLPGAAAILFALDPALVPTGVAPIGVALIVMIAVAWHLEARHKILRTGTASIAIAMIERIARSPELDLMGRTDRELRDQPKKAYIGDDFIGLQGSLRRVATLLSHKRPDDRRIQEVLADYGLDHLLRRDRGLDTRIDEAARTLTSDETLRLDLARAELGKVRLLILDSVRLRASSNRKDLIEMFSNRCNATILVVEEPKQIALPTTRPEPHAYEIYNST